MSDFPDISEHQDDLSVDWFRQWPAIIIRAHSGYRRDKHFFENWERARQAGIPRGVYGYVVPDQDPRWQAEQLLMLTHDDEPELGYWSDLEQEGLTREQAWAHHSTLPAGRRGVYANGGDFDAMTDGRFDSSPWWAAGYPRVVGGYRPYLFHQYQGSPLDMNRGDLDAIRAAVNDGLAPAPATPAAPELIEVPDMLLVIQKPVAGADPVCSLFAANGGTVVSAAQAWTLATQKVPHLDNVEPLTALAIAKGLDPVGFAQLFHA